MKWHFIVLTKFVLFMEHISNKVLVLEIHGWPDVPYPLIMTGAAFWDTETLRTLVLKCQCPMVCSFPWV